MTKLKSTFLCQSCGYESVKWLGKCPNCSKWNTFSEESALSSKNKITQLTNSKFIKKTISQPFPIYTISTKKECRLDTQDQELNRLLGGGIVLGSIVLMGGEPGIGKSTLMLQLALSIKETKVLYVSGEESPRQIRMRAERLSIHSDNCYILSETETQSIFTHIEKILPQLIIIDSIQTLQTAHIESIAGSVAQVRACAIELLYLAKKMHIPIVLIGHITKEGYLAGPKTLEHMVDTVLYFEGDRRSNHRILRTIKNRFGPSSELGIYQMRYNGLQPVANPSEILISQREENLSGVSISAILEGSRPLLVEIQSLVSPSAYATPQRSSTGFDAKRLNMLLAVLEKRCGFKLHSSDVFLNITGGLKIEDTAMDLAICTSIISSINDCPVSSAACFAAEVGLGGEIRAVHHTEKRISEAQKLGFRTIYISKFNMKGLNFNNCHIQIIPLSGLSDLIHQAFHQKS